MESVSQLAERRKHSQDAVVEAKSWEEQVEDAHLAAQDGHAATDQHVFTLLFISVSLIPLLRLGRPVVVIDLEAERRLLWKIDLMVLPIASLISAFSFLDRSNIANARIAGLEASLGMHGNDYSIAVTIYFVIYTIFELPAVSFCKYAGPGWILPITTILFGVICVCTGFVHTFPQLCATRVLLGIFEAPVLGGTGYYLTRWYRRDELSFRFGIFCTMAPIMGATSGLLASAILSMDHFGSLTGWRMILGVEGVISIGLGVVALLIYTDRPETAIWLNEEEKELAVARLKVERVATTEILDKMEWSKYIRGLWNPAVLATAMIYMLSSITTQGVSFFLPTIINTIYPSASVVRQQLWTVPPWSVAIASDLIFPFLSWKFGRRMIFIAVLAPLVIVGYAMFLATTDAHVRFGALFLIIFGVMPTSPLCQAQIAANVVSDTARSSAYALHVIFNNLGGIIGTWAFLPSDGPKYYKGNGLNLGSTLAYLGLTIGLMTWMFWDNKRRGKRDTNAELNGLSLKQIHDLDWRHPSFRWRP